MCAFSVFDYINCYEYKCCPLDIVVAALGMVISVVVFCVLTVVLIAIVVGSVVVVVVVMVVLMVEVLMVGSTLLDTVVDSGPEFTLLIIANRTNPNIPIPKSAPRTRKRESGLKLHLLCFRVDTCPSLGGLTGWRKITTLVSFPFISATEPRKVLHLQFVRL